MDVGTRKITVSSCSDSKQLALNNNLWFIFIANMAVNKMKYSSMDILIHNFIF